VDEKIRNPWELQKKKFTKYKEGANTAGGLQNSVCVVKCKLGIRGNIGPCLVIIKNVKNWKKNDTNMHERRPVILTGEETKQYELYERKIGEKKDVTRPAPGGDLEKKVTEIERGKNPLPEMGLHRKEN